MRMLELLVNGDVDGAFRLLKEAYRVSPKEWGGAAILLNRYRRMKEDEIKGILSYERRNLVKNVLVDDMITYLQLRESGGQSTPEPSLKVIEAIINEDSLLQMEQDLKLLEQDFPGSKLITIAKTTIDLRKGLNTVSRVTVDSGFIQLHEILKTNDTDFYKTVFCLMLVYKIQFYEVWSLPLPIHFDFTYNTYIGTSPLLREFLVKLKLSPKAKQEIRSVYKSL